VDEVYKGDIEMTIEICENIGKYDPEVALRLCDSLGDCCYKTQHGKHDYCLEHGLVSGK